MNLLLRISALALLLSFSTQAQACDPSNVKVDAGVNIRFNVYFQDQPPPPLAPWYLYWPAEAANLPTGGPGGPGTMQFPNWPAQWPAGTDKKTPEVPKMPMASMATPSGAAPHYPYGPPHQPTAPPGAFPGSQPQTYQPVGYFTQAPGYWYGK